MLGDLNPASAAISACDFRLCSSRIRRLTSWAAGDFGEALDFVVTFVLAIVLKYNNYSDATMGYVVRWVGSVRQLTPGPRWRNSVKTTTRFDPQRDRQQTSDLARERVGANRAPLTVQARKSFRPSAGAVKEFKRLCFGFDQCSCGS